MPTQEDNNYPLLILPRRITQAELDTFFAKKPPTFTASAPMPTNLVGTSLSLKSPRLKRTNKTSIARAAPGQEIKLNHHPLATPRQQVL